jgi:hypothetical protein
MPDRPKDAMMAFLENMQLELTESYLRRGKQLANVPTDELKERWVIEMRLWAADYGRTIDHTRREDAQAELLLRGVALPFDLAADAVTALCLKQDAQLSARDAESRARLDRKIGDELEQFLASITRAKPN